PARGCSSRTRRRPGARRGRRRRPCSVQAPETAICHRTPYSGAGSCCHHHIVEGRVIEASRIRRRPIRRGGGRRPGSWGNPASFPGPSFTVARPLVERAGHAPVAEDDLVQPAGSEEVDLLFEGHELTIRRAPVCPLHFSLSRTTESYLANGMNQHVRCCERAFSHVF